jgi:hypothetical protein
VEALSLIECQRNGRIVAENIFDSTDLAAGIEALDARSAELTAEAGNVAWRAALQLTDAQNRHDWEGVIGVLDPAYVRLNNRSLVRLRLQGEEALNVHRIALAIDDLKEERTLVAMRGEHLALTRLALSFVVGDAGPSELEELSLVECGPDGRIVAAIGFDTDDLDRALEELDARHAELTAGEGNAAWRAALRLSDAQARHDWQSVRDVLDPAFVNVDHRQGMRLHFHGEDALEVHKFAIALDDLKDERTLIATRGENLALTRNTMSFVVGDAGPSEVEVLSLIECRPDGCIVAENFFDSSDLAGAIEALDARHAEMNAGSETAVWGAIQRWYEALNRGDWQTFEENLAPGFVCVDNRVAWRLRLEGEDALDNVRTMFTLDDCRCERTLLATRGDRLALVRSIISFVDGQAGPSEVESISIVECDADGRIVSNTAFNPDDLESASEALESRYAELT